MDRLKTLLKYVIWALIFIVFSEFLINVGLNSTYKKIDRKDNIEQVNIYQAEATSVNGRIRGTITNTQLNGNYVRIDFYSKRDIFLGRRYIEITNLEENETMNLEVFFKLQNVKSYEIVITDHKNQENEIEFIPKEWTKPEIIITAAIMAVMFI